MTGTLKVASTLEKEYLIFPLEYFYLLYGTDYTKPYIALAISVATGQVIDYTEVGVVAPRTTTVIPGVGDAYIRNPTPFQHISSHIK